MASARSTKREWRKPEVAGQHARVFTFLRSNSEGVARANTQPKTERPPQPEATGARARTMGNRTRSGVLAKRQRSQNEATKPKTTRAAAAEGKHGQCRDRRERAGVRGQGSPRSMSRCCCLLSWCSVLARPPIHERANDDADDCNY